jgi:hypothetical protein
VKRDLAGALRALALPTLALIGVAAIAPGRFELAARIYALVLAAAIATLALLALARAFPRETRPDTTDRGLRHAQQPPSLGRVENEVVLGVASATDLHFRLVPRLRAVATGLLAARRGVSLTADPERARALLGDDAWSLVRPDRPAPHDRLAAGIPVPDLERALDALERV